MSRTGIIVCTLLTAAILVGIKYGMQWLTQFMSPGFQSGLLTGWFSMGVFAAVILVLEKRSAARRSGE